MCSAMHFKLQLYLLIPVVLSGGMLLQWFVQSHYQIWQDAMRSAANIYILKHYCILRLC